MARILVVVDDETLLTTLEQLLLAAGHAVVTAPDGLEAAKLFRAEPFELVLTDMVMPNRAGRENILALWAGRPARSDSLRSPARRFRRPRDDRAGEGEVAAHTGDFAHRWVA